MSVAGSLFGLAFGDALGAPTEFLPVAEIERWYGPGGPADLPERARVTDDTQMALAVGWALHHAAAYTPRASFIATGWRECVAVLDRLDAALVAPDRDADPCLATGAGWIAEEALATALYCALLYPGDPRAALRRAACTSGDSDSIACLTGAFHGAASGLAGWPDGWRQRIEYADQLSALAAWATPK